MKNTTYNHNNKERNRFPVFGKIVTSIAFLLSIITGYAQNPTIKVFEDWNTTSATQNTFQRSVVRSMGLGGTTYYYVAGATLDTNGRYDMLVQKLNTSGTVLWSQTYNGTGNGDDVAMDVQIDAVGNVYICGSLTSTRPTV